MTTTTARPTATRLRAASLAALLGIGAISGVAACSDEDGDGGTTDEEIQDGKDTVDSIEGEVEEEVDAQDQGTNKDGEYRYPAGAGPATATGRVTTRANP